MGSKITRKRRTSLSRLFIAPLFVVFALCLYALGLSAFFGSTQSDTYVPSFPALQTSIGHKSPEVCFVTAVYSGDVKKADKVASVEALAIINPAFQFYLFTNIDDLNPKGWTKIVTNLPYRRFITHSRYGKFLGWKHPQIFECGVVFYIDGIVKPLIEEGIWKKLASQIRESENGLMQYKHPDGRKGPRDELIKVIFGMKDIKSNVEASIQWLREQPDYDPNSQVYLNQCFGYDPKNQHFQEATEAFWSRYSLEVDSWRDQALWAYILHHKKLVPLAFPSDPPREKLFQLSKQAIGFGGHRYTAASDKDAVNTR